MATNIKAQLPNGEVIEIEAVSTREGGPVAFAPEVAFPLDSIKGAIIGISQVAIDAMKAAKPTSAKIEFGLKVGFEPGKLTALLVQGSGEANLTVSLEWSS